MNQIEPAQPSTADDAYIVRSIALDPCDWAWATWRPRPQLPPEPRPFDRQACAARLARIGASNQGWDWHWEQADIPGVMTTEEATFWLAARFKATGNTTPAALAADLARRTTDDSYSDEQILARLQANPRMLQDWLLVVLARLWPFEKLAALLLSPIANATSYSVHYLFAEFLRYVVPTIDEQDLEKLRMELRPTIRPENWPKLSNEALNRFHLAACLGMHPELAAVVASWADDVFAAHPHTETFHSPQYVIFGLGDGNSVASQMRRLKLMLKTAQQVRAWLACTEYDGLDLVHESILATPKNSAGDLVQALALVKAPETAPIMLELLQTGVPSVVVAARSWLDENPLHAIPGLIPLARRGTKIGEAATQVLRDLRRRGHHDYMERCLSLLVADRARSRLEMIAEKDCASPAFDEQTTPAWLSDLMPPGGSDRSKLPDWLQIGDLPPIMIGSHRLSEEQVAVVLDEIQSADLRFPRHLFAALKEHAERASLDAFAWDLFERWQGQGFPANDRWTMAAIGLLGGDASVLKLTPLVRVWPGQSHSARAAHGLDCLRAVGSETALMQLHGIAQKIKYPALKTRAKECMESIAAERGMSPAELEDCIVPDCGLDEHGGRLFDFGPRRFTFVMGKDLKPMVRDEDGKLKASLPRPIARDDANKANEAIASWNLLKKTLREMLKMQSLRLERAMVSGRRWTFDHFAARLVRHPLMSHLARRLIWGIFETGDLLRASFRVTDERDFADSKDQPVAVSGSCIGIVHPAHLQPDEASAWGEVLNEYEIIPPFPQLARRVLKLEPREEDQTEITRFNRVQLEPMVLSAILDRQGWKRDSLTSAMVEMTFPNADITAVIECEGPLLHEARGIECCYFVAGGGGNKTKRLKLGQVHPVVMSEVLRDLVALQNAMK